MSESKIQTIEKPSTKRKREICQRCIRPTPSTCICAALPSQPLVLFKSRVLVLQHPTECKRKNRSLPLIELSLNNQSTRNDGKEEDADADADANFDFTFHTIVARWWGEQVAEPAIWKLVNNPDEPVLLCFPSDDAISVQEAMERISVERSQRLQDQESESCNGSNNEETSQSQPQPLSDKDFKVNIIFLDATWKYAKEMDTKTIQNGGWPKHTIRVKLDPSKDCKDSFQPRRFDIRAPPTENHLSTAECIAHVLRIVEGDDSVFDILMRPLDLMVQQWHSFAEDKKKLKIDNNKGGT